MGFYKNINAEISKFPWDFNMSPGYERETMTISIDQDRPYLITDEMKKNISDVEDFDGYRGRLSERMDDVNFIRALSKDELKDMLKDKTSKIDCNYCIFNGTWACAKMTCAAEENLGAYVNDSDRCVCYV